MEAKSALWREGGVEPERFSLVWGFFARKRKRKLRKKCLARCGRLRCLEKLPRRTLAVGESPKVAAILWIAPICHFSTTKTYLADNRGRTRGPIVARFSASAGLQLRWCVLCKSRGGGGGEKEAEREDYFRTTFTKNSGAKFKFRYLRFFENYLPFSFSNQKEWTSQKCFKNSLKLHALFFTLQPVFAALKTFSKIVANHRLLATVHQKQQ